MIKSIFYKMLKNPENRAKLASLKGEKEVYQLFCENGYSKDFDSFEKELNEFLNSAEIQNLVSAENCELSGEKLANVSGGAGVSRRALVGGVATLMAALSLSASASANGGADIGYSKPSPAPSTLSNFGPVVDAGNNEKPKTMAEEIEEKAKPGALKKLPNKDEEHKKFVQIGLKLRKAIKNKRNNVNMNNNENQNSTNRGAQNVDNVAANAGAKTMAEEIAEKAKPGALKKLPNKDEEHKKFVKIGLKLRKAIKNKRNNVNMNNNENQNSTNRGAQNVDNVAANARAKTMAEEIAEKAKPGALKKLPNKDEEHKKFVKIGLKLRKAIKNKRNNVNMNNNENENSTNRGAQNVDNVAANARAKTMAEEIAEKKLKLDKQRAEKRNNVNEKRVENEKR